MSRLRKFYFRHAPLPRLKPGFLIIGAQKCGTTSLAKWLGQHPSILPPRTKELRYFSTDQEHAKGPEWYFSNFPPRPLNPFRKAMSFEATPYLFQPSAPEWIAATLGPVPKIILLRDPVERAISHYKHSIRKGRETRGLGEAIFAELDALQGNGPADSAGTIYVAKGLYIRQIDAWLKHHPPSSFLILRSEEMFQDPLATIRKCLDFIGLPHTRTDRIQTDARNVNPRKAEVPQEVRDRLAAFYQEPNRELASRYGISW